MPVFKTSLRIVKQNLIAVATYLGVFLVLAIIFTNNAKETDESAFKTKSILLGIVDQDKSSTSEAIIDYLSEHHTSLKTLY